MLLQSALLLDVERVHVQRVAVVEFEGIAGIEQILDQLLEQRLFCREEKKMRGSQTRVSILPLVRPLWFHALPHYLPKALGDVGQLVLVDLQKLLVLHF